MELSEGQPGAVATKAVWVWHRLPLELPGKASAQRHLLSATVGFIVSEPSGPASIISQHQPPASTACVPCTQRVAADAPQQWAAAWLELCRAESWKVFLALCPSFKPESPFQTAARSCRGRQHRRNSVGQHRLYRLLLPLAGSGGTGASEPGSSLAGDLLSAVREAQEAALGPDPDAQAQQAAGELKMWRCNIWEASHHLFCNLHSTPSSISSVSSGTFSFCSCNASAHAQLQHSRRLARCLVVSLLHLPWKTTRHLSAARRLSFNTIKCGLPAEQLLGMTTLSSRVCVAWQLAQLQ